MNTHSKKFTCPICQKDFARAYTLSRHQEQIHTRGDNDEDEIHTNKKRGKLKKVWSCPTCGRQLCSKFSLTQHLEKVCNSPQNNNTSTLEMKIKEVEDKLRKEFDEKIKSHPSNTLQIICVTSHDNYLDMLSDKMNNFNQAIDYIKECALSDLVGDCKLIEKIYCDQEEQQIFYIDKKKSKIKYHSETEEIIESKESFGRKLANNLQNTYLKGINYLINKNLETHMSPNKFLENYDIMTWNTHVYNLSDTRYQNKMINQLSIPVMD